MTLAGPTCHKSVGLSRSEKFAFEGNISLASLAVPRLPVKTERAPPLPATTRHSSSERSRPFFFYWVICLGQLASKHIVGLLMMGRVCFEAY